jgi:hypothetical protein
VAGSSQPPHRRIACLLRDVKSSRRPTCRSSDWTGRLQPRPGRCFVLPTAGRLLVAARLLSRLRATHVESGSRGVAVAGRWGTSCLATSRCGGAGQVQGILSVQPSAVGGSDLGFLRERSVRTFHPVSHGHTTFHPRPSAASTAALTCEPRMPRRPSGSKYLLPFLVYCSFRSQ